MIIRVCAFFEVFGQKARLEPEWRVWSGNAVRESRSACRSSESARLGLDDLAKVITHFTFLSDFLGRRARLYVRIDCML